MQLKRLWTFCLAGLLLLGLAVPALGAEATPTSSAVLVDGGKVDFVAYNIGGNNYFKLRDIAQALSGSASSFEVGWDAVRRVISLTSGEVYTSVGGELSGAVSENPQPVKTTATLTIDGRAFGITAYNIDGNNFFKLRDLATVLDFGVGWDAGANTITIATAESYAPPVGAAGALPLLNSYPLLLVGKMKEQVALLPGAGEPTDSLCILESGVTLGLETDANGVSAVTSVRGQLSHLVANCPDKLALEEIRALFGAAHVTYDEQERVYCTVADYGGYSVVIFGERSGAASKEAVFLYSIHYAYEEHAADRDGLWTGENVSLTVSAYTGSTLVAAASVESEAGKAAFTTTFYSDDDPNLYEGYWFYDESGNRLTASLRFLEDGTAHLVVEIAKAAGVGAAAACDVVLQLAP